ncbi:hypothetical protein [Algibacter sp. PT7-4]|uniref:hypothetical protein n=1 Tax=Algibacter ulvanivorans TaxID=3400999 RepID=UPI003AB0FC78
MLNTNKIKLYLSSLILLITLSSFSGHVNAPTGIEKPQTEILASNNSIYNTVTKNYYLTKLPLKVSLKYFIKFNFKALLNNKLSNVSNALKSQKVILLQFLNHLVLEQNLMVQIKTVCYQK